MLEPPRGWRTVGLGELWAARDLLYFLTWRDIKVRYSQAAIGIAWSVIQPLLMMAVFSIVLGRLAKVPSDDLPYPVFVFTGLAPWTFFVNAVRTSAESLVASSNLVSKVYFPRLVIPLAALLSWLPDLAISSVLVVVLSLIYGLVPPWTVVLFPALAVLTFLAAAAVSVWLSALNVAYRDVRYAVPFFIQLWLFATPVLYPPSLVPEQFRALLGLNPMAGVVESFRWALTGTDPLWSVIGLSLAVTTVSVVAGLYYFRRVEHFFADLI